VTERNKIVVFNITTKIQETQNLRPPQQWSSLHPEDGGNMDLWNISIVPHHYI